MHNIGALVIRKNGVLGPIVKELDKGTSKLNSSIGN